MGIVSFPTVSCCFIWTLLLIQLERWARKVSLWIFHSKEAGWCFVTGRNETTYMWWNQDLQVVVQILGPPSLYVWCTLWIFLKTFLVAQTVKCLPTMWETWVRFLGQEDLLEKEMATHSSTLAWKIQWTEEPGRLQSMGSQRVGHDWATSLTHSLWIFSIYSELYIFIFPQR